MLRGYVAMGSGNCRFRRKEAQLCSAARKVQINAESKDRLMGGRISVE